MATKADAKKTVEELKNNSSFRAEVETYGTQGNIQVKGKLHYHNTHLIQEKGYQLKFSCNEWLVFKPT